MQDPDEDAWSCDPLSRPVTQPLLQRNPSAFSQDVVSELTYSYSAGRLSDAAPTHVGTIVLLLAS
jgi:hypothetical protein